MGEVFKSNRLINLFLVNIVIMTEEIEEEIEEVIEVVIEEEIEVEIEVEIEEVEIEAEDRHHVDLTIIDHP